MNAENMENIPSCIRCNGIVFSPNASYCQTCGLYLGHKVNSFLDNSSLGRNNWWIWVVFTATFVVIWQIIGSLPLVGFCGILNVVELGSYTCDLETFIVTGNSKVPNFFLMHFSFVIGAGGFYILLKALHHKNILQVLTERIQFDYQRSFFALSVFFVLAGLSLLANIITDPSGLKFRGDGSDLLVIALIALIFVPIQSGLEEAFFRGYLLQGFSLLIKSRTAILILTSMIFASLHLFNPEPWSYGFLPYLFAVFSVGIFMGLITLMDGGIELAVGIHIANNLWVHLILGLEDSVIPSSSLFIALNQDLDFISTIIPLLLQYALLTAIFAIKYKWFGKVGQYPSF